MSDPTATLPRILVVDDEPIIVRTLNEVLKTRYRLQLAVTGEEALATAISSAPDLILLDIGLPDLEQNRMQNEKMISLGQLTAGVAHEINNPLEGVVRATKIVPELTHFGRMDPLEQEPVALTSCLESALTIGDNDQFIASAVAEEISALTTETYLAQRATDRLERITESQPCGSAGEAVASRTLLEVFGGDDQGVTENFGGTGKDRSQGKYLPPVRTVDYPAAVVRGSLVKGVTGRPGRPAAREVVCPGEVEMEFVTAPVVGLRVDRAERIPRHAGEFPQWRQPGHRQSGIDGVPVLAEVQRPALLVTSRRQVY